MNPVRILVLHLILLSLVSCTRDAASDRRTMELPDRHPLAAQQELNEQTIDRKQHYIDDICSSIAPKYSFTYINANERCIASTDNLQGDINDCYAVRIDEFTENVNTALINTSQIRKHGGKYFRTQNSVKYSPLCVAVVQELIIPNTFIQKRQYSVAELKFIKESLLRAYKNGLEKGLKIVEVPVPDQCKNALRMYLAEQVKSFTGNTISETQKKRIRMAQMNYGRCKEQAYIHGNYNVIPKDSQQPGAQREKKIEPLSASPSQSKNRNSSARIQPMMDSDRTDDEKEIIIRNISVREISK